MHMSRRAVKRLTKLLWGLLIAVLAVTLYQQLKGDRPSGSPAGEARRRQAAVPNAAPASAPVPTASPAPAPTKVAAKVPAQVPAKVSAQVPAGAQPAVVEKVVDGDTIWVAVNQPGGSLARGATYKIRILEIDTPETVKPYAQVQCGGTAASEFARRELAVGSTVYLLSDRQDTDRYGRFLRYVWNEKGEFYNEKAVRLGYARAVLYAPNDRYIGRIRAAEAKARASSSGIWGAPCSIRSTARVSAPDVG